MQLYKQGKQSNQGQINRIGFCIQPLSSSTTSLLPSNSFTMEQQQTLTCALWALGKLFASSLRPGQLLSAPCHKPLSPYSFARFIPHFLHHIVSKCAHRPDEEVPRLLSPSPSPSNSLKGRCIIVKIPVKQMPSNASLN